MLPRIIQPTFHVTLPSTGEIVKFRPFLVSEEKLLLIAEEGKDILDILDAVKQVVGNCLIGCKTPVDKMPLFDLEYLYIKIRAKSVNNFVDLKYTDYEDGKQYTFTLNLDELEVTKFPEHTNKIQVTDKIGVIMKYPTADLVISLIGAEDSPKKLLIGCIDKVWDEKKMYPATDEAETEAWLNDLTFEQKATLAKFFETSPRLSHTLTYVNEKGNERKITLQGIRDFLP